MIRTFVQFPDDDPALGLRFARTGTFSTDDRVYIGFAVAGAGDFDGDGLGDFVFGTPDITLSGSSAGHRGLAQLVLGKDLPTLHDATFETAMGEVVEYWSSPVQRITILGGHAGRSVAGIGDFDGDGLDDIAIGNPEEAPTGAVHIIYGQATPTFSSSSQPIDAWQNASDTTFLNERWGDPFFSFGSVSTGEAHSRLGLSVSSAGDFNGDGLDDMLIADDIGVAAAHILFGTSTRHPTATTPADFDGANGFTLRAAGTGGTVTAIGDFNGDGRDDIAVGRAGSNGFTYVLYGRDGPFDPVIDLAAMADGAGFRVDAAGAVKPAGDLNGDGLDDLVIGDTVLFGTPGGHSGNVSLGALTAAQRMSFNGSQGAGIGDVNGDGFDDFGYVTGGTAVVLFGRPGGPADLPHDGSADGSGGYVIRNATNAFYNRFAEASIAGLGDVNGDGIGDFLLGSSYEDLPLQTSTQLVYGVNATPEAADDAFATLGDAVISGNLFADNGAGADRDDSPLGLLHVTGVNGAAAVGESVELPSGAFVSVYADGTFDYDPRGGFATLIRDVTAVDSFTYTVSDGVHTDTATVSVTLTGTYQPSALSGTLSGTVVEGDAGDVSEASGALVLTPLLPDHAASFADVAAVAGDAGLGQFALEGGVWRYTLDQAAVQAMRDGETATDATTFIARDGTRATVSVTIEGRDDAPIFRDAAIPTLYPSSLTGFWHPAFESYGVWTTQNAVVEAPVGDVRVTRVFEAPRSGDYVLELSADDSVSLDIDGAFALSHDFLGSLARTTVSLDAGPHAMDLRAANFVGPAGITLTVRDAETGFVLWSLRDALAPDTVDLDDMVTEVEADAVGFEIVGGNHAALLAGNTLHFDRAAFAETLAPGETGTATVTVRATDATGLATLQDFVFTETRPNAAPEASDDILAPLPETGGARLFDVLANDADPDGAADALSLAAIEAVTVLPGQFSGPPAALGLAIDGDQLRFDPTTGFAALETGEIAQLSVRYRVSDGAGLSDSATAILTVIGESSAPEAVAPALVPLHASGRPEGWHPLFEEAGVWIAPATSPAGAPGTPPGTVSFTRLVTVPETGEHVVQLAAQGSATLRLNGETLTSDAGPGESAARTFELEAGTHVLDLDVTHAGGPGGVALQIDDLLRQFSWSLLDARAHPVVDLATVFSDREDGTDALRYEIVAQPAEGTLALSGSLLHFAPGPDRDGPAEDALAEVQAVVRATDTSGRATQTTLVLPVVGQNAPPRTQDDTGETLQGQPLVLDVLANDTDPTDEALRIASVTEPAHGTVWFHTDGRSLIYRPADGFTGTDTFTYVARDARGAVASDPAQVVVTVFNADGSPGVAETRVKTDGTGPGNRFSWQERVSLLDAEGRLLEQRLHYDDGTRETRSFGYDETGARVSMLRTDGAGAEGRFAWSSMETTYRPDGAVAARHVVFDDGREDVRSYLYDAEGARVGVLRQDGTGAQDRFAWSTLETTFRPDGAVAARHVVFDDGREDLRSFLYDETGARIGVVRHDGTGAQDRFSSSTLETLYGPDGTVDSQRLVFDDGARETRSFTYDATGARIATLREDGAGAEGRFAWSSLHTEYHVDGRTAQQVIRFDDGGEETRLFDYDASGTPIGVFRVDGLGAANRAPWSMIETRFGADGVVDVKVIDNDDGTRETRTYRRDPEGRVLSETRTDTSDIVEFPWSRQELRYSDDGRIEEHVLLFDDGGRETRSFGYDAEGARVSMVRTDGTGAENRFDWARIETAYLPNGRAVTQTVLYDDGGRETRSFGHDADGNRISMLRTDGTGAENRFAWSTALSRYDAEGNLIDRTFAWDGAIAPTFAAGGLAVREDGAAASLDLATLGDDGSHDESGATLAYALLSPPAEGRAWIEGTRLGFDPGAGFQDLADGATRQVALDLRATDRDGASADGTVTVTVTGVNDGPTLAAGTLAATEDGRAVTLDLAALGDDVDADDDGSSLSYELLSPPVEGTARIDGTVLTFDPGSAFEDLAEGATRQITLNLRATDRHGASADSAFTVTVTGANDAPVFSAAAISALYPSGRLDAWDPGLEAHGVWTTPNAASGAPAGDIRFTRVFDVPAAGNYVVEMRVDDRAWLDWNDSDRSFLLFNDVRNPYPRATVFLEEGPRAFDVLAANDGGSAGLFLTVSDAATGHIVWGLGDALAPDTVDLDHMVTDAEGEAITFEIASGAHAGLLAGNVLHFDRAAFIGTLEPGETGSATVTVRATDAFGDSTLKDFSFAATRPDTPPEARDDAFETRSDGVISGNLLADNGAGADTDAQTPGALRIAAVNGDAAQVGQSLQLASGAYVSVYADGTFDYDPRGGFASLPRDVRATDGFTYTLSDGRLTDTATVSFGITGTNDRPTLAAGVLAADEDGVAVTLDLATLGDDANPDESGATLRYELVSGPAEGSARVDGTVLSFDPGAGFQDLTEGATRQVTLNLRASDRHGASAENAVTVTVRGINDAPRATPSVFGSVSEEDGVLTLALAGLGSDPDTGDTLSIANLSASDDLGNAVPLTDLGGGAARFDTGFYRDLSTGQTATVTVSYDLTDGRAFTPNTLTFAVEGVTQNIAPIAEDDRFVPSGRVGVYSPTLASTSVYNAQISDLLESMDVFSSVSILTGLETGPELLERYDSILLDGYGTHNWHLPKNAEAMDYYVLNGGGVVATLDAIWHSSFGRFNNMFETGLVQSTWKRKYAGSGTREMGDFDAGHQIMSWPFDITSFSANHSFGGYYLMPNTETVAAFTYGGPVVMLSESGKTIGLPFQPLGHLGAMHGDWKELIANAVAYRGLGPYTNYMTPIEIPVLANDSDPDGNPGLWNYLTVTDVSPVSALGAHVSIDERGDVDYDPRPSLVLRKMARDDVVEDSFTYTVMDVAGATATATATLSVGGRVGRREVTLTFDDLPAPETRATDERFHREYGMDFWKPSVFGVPPGEPAPEEAFPTSDTLIFGNLDTPGTSSSIYLFESSGLFFDLDSIDVLEGSVRILHRGMVLRTIDTPGEDIAINLSGMDMLVFQTDGRAVLDNFDIAVL